MEISPATTPSCQIFNGLSLPSFSQAIDPLDADDWLRTMENKVEVSRIDEEDKVPFVTRYLEGVATIWWENEKAMGTAEEEITWSRIKEQFRKYHIPTGIMKTKQCEFLQIFSHRLPSLEEREKFTLLSLHNSRRDEIFPKSFLES